jgi:hypothetical protein
MLLSNDLQPTLLCFSRHLLITMSNMRPAIRVPAVKDCVGAPRVQWFARTETSQSIWEEKRPDDGFVRDSILDALHRDQDKMRGRKQLSAYNSIRHRYDEDCIVLSENALHNQ